MIAHFLNEFFQIIRMNRFAFIAKDLASPYKLDFHQMQSKFI